MLLLLGALLLQVDPDAIRRLGDPDVAVRDQATATLKQLPVARSEDLRKLAKGETDPERRGRLLAVVRHLAGRESEALYQDGRLEESLLKLAESEGAAEPAEEVGRRLAAARTSLKDIWTHDAEPGCKILFPDGQRDEVRSHGRYALLPLIEGLSGSHAFSAHYMLTHWIPDPVPALCGQLRGKEVPSAQGACHILGWFQDARSVAMLRSIRNDPARSASLRDCALDVLQNTRVYPESCEPDVIERLVRELGSDEAAERERATSALKEHPPGILKQLRMLSTTVTDAEQRERLATVLRHLAGRKAAQLYEDGQLDEALLQIAEGEGAPDPAVEVEQRLQEAAGFLASEFTLDGYSVRQNWTDPLAGERLRKHGYFAVAALLRMLDERSAGKAYLMLIQYPAGLDVVPALCGDLRGPEKPRSYKVCHALGRIGGDGAVRKLQEIRDDPSRSERLRRFALEGLKDLGIVPKE